MLVSQASTVERRLGVAPASGTVLAGAVAVVLQVWLLGWVAQSYPGAADWSAVVPLASLAGLGIGALCTPRATTITIARWSIGTAWTILVLAAQVPAIRGHQVLAIVVVTVAGGALMAGMGQLIAAIGTPAERGGRLLAAGAFVGLLAGGALVGLAAPPVAWAVVSAVGVVGLTWSPWPGQEPLPAGNAGPGRSSASHPGAGYLALLLVPVAALAVVTVDTSSTWSPYARVQTWPELDGTTELAVNRQPRGDIRDAWSWQRENPVVGAPYDEVRAGPPARVLVLHAGAGNAVARALAADPHRVDAVEPDRAIVAAGRRFHPEQPYADSRVTVHVEDPRAALRRLGGPYDLVVLARTDPALLTVEALERARSLLAPNGAVGFHSHDRAQLRPALAAAEEAFGHRPCALDTDRGTAVVAALAARQQACSYERPGPTIGAVRTDDAPTLPARAAPGMLAGLAVLVLLAAGLTWQVRRPGRRSSGIGPLLVVGAVAGTHAVAAVGVTGLLLERSWLVPLTVLAGWLLPPLVALVLPRIPHDNVRGPTMRQPSGGRSGLALAGLLVTLAAGVAATTTGLASAATLPRLLTAAVVVVGVPVAAWVWVAPHLLPGQDGRSEADDPAGASSGGRTVAGLAIGALAGAAVAFVATPIGFSALFAITAVIAVTGAAVVHARRRRTPVDA